MGSLLHVPASFARRQLGVVVAVVFVASSWPACSDDGGSTPLGSAGGGRAGTGAGQAGTGNAGTGAGASGAAGSSSSGNGGSGAGDAGAATSPEPCAAYAASYCARLAECAPARLRLVYEDAAACPAIVARDCAMDLGDGIGVADRAACASSLESASCEELLSATSPGCAPSPGSRAGGEPCRANAQCESNLCVFDGSPCGRCAAVLSEGEPCGTVPGGCGPGLACDVGGTDECAPLQVQGADEPCDDNELRCGPGWFCASSGTCQPVLLEGDSCSAEPSGCDPRRSLYCVAGACGPLDVLVEPGGACGVEGTPFPRCSDPLYCDATTNACVRRAQAGESCGDDPVAGSTCDAPFTCVGGTCVTYEERCP